MLESKKQVKFFESIKSGKGVEVKKNDDKFVGFWLNNKKHGEFKVTYANGDTYIGPYFEGQMNGGVFTRKNGDTYKGEWLDDEKYHGQGKWTSGDGKSWYEGQWSNNMYHGQGKETNARGDCYEGPFVGGKKQGYGTNIESTGWKKEG